MAGSQAAVEMLTALREDGDWFPHTVLPHDGEPGAFDTPWTHDTDR